MTFLENVQECQEYFFMEKNTFIAWVIWGKIALKVGMTEEISVSNLLALQQQKEKQCVEIA